MQYTLRQVAEKLGVSVYTVRYWIKEGKIATVRTLGGHHRITQRELDQLLGEKNAVGGESGCTTAFKGTHVIIYSRVSSSENKANLESQAQRLSDYSIAKGYQIHKMLKEVGSGINDSRSKLLWLMDYVVNHPIDKIVVEHKDRLTRLGFTYLEKYFKGHGVEIEVVNQTLDAKEDLMNDFVSIITSFVARLNAVVQPLSPHGLRRSKRKTEKLIKELTNENN